MRANAAQAIAMPGNGRESGHRVRGCGISGNSVAGIVRRRTQNCAIARPPRFHLMKGFCKPFESRAGNPLMQRDNLYHNAI
ncbi:hypothetical protein [Burkholderia ambifaria]|uniref:hypothetical protein n=1 Tax=Burkholderia ambifaria TaxID=152480 RepID=UPI001ABAE436|nr:hypothetical protein [Burkholderia ambifaria]